MKNVGIIAILLVVLVASAAFAATTTLTGTFTTSGSLTTYDYTLLSKEVGDNITGFHIYSPTSVHSILSGWGDTGWSFRVDPDPYTGGSDLYWFMPEEVGPGLTYDKTLQIHITTPVAVPVQSGFILPDYSGNWGLDTMIWAEYGTIVMDGSVIVPGAAEPMATPEPSSIMVLISGCALLKLRKRN